MTDYFYFLFKILLAAAAAPKFIFGQAPKVKFFCFPFKNPFKRLPFRKDPGSGIPAGAPKSSFFFKNPLKKSRCLQHNFY